MTSGWPRSLSVLLFGFVLLGCSSWNPLTQRGQSPDEAVEGGDKNTLVGDLAVPFGTFPVRVESVGLVTSLPGTGADPVPSASRAAIVQDMRTRGVTHPDRILASKDTALVLVRGILRPGVQPGDRFDVEVRVPTQDETVSLRGGWMLETRLKELALLDGGLHEGRDWALADGPVLVDPSADVSKDPVLASRGRILGGGHVIRGRALGLVLKPKHQNVYNATRVATAINRRFYRNVGGLQEGVAKAHTDQHIELALHPRYKDNIDRYMDVVRAIAVQETPAERFQRLSLLERQLLDPITAARAARQLEAIGRDGIDMLKKGLESDDREVRFRAAEALAYLDQTEAARPLGEAARNEPAFRVFALTALGAMNDLAAHEELCALLEVPSAETRYGAFRALWTMNPADRRVQGEELADQFFYHVVDTQGPPMVHVTRSRRAELVLFGRNQQLRPPVLLEAGPRIRVASAGPGEIAVSRFAVGLPDQKRIVSCSVDEVVRAIVELGGTYPDVVQALQQAKAKGTLESRFEVDALPEAGRTYERGDESAKDAAAKAKPGFFSRERWAGLWGGKKDAAADDESSPPATTSVETTTDSGHLDAPAGDSDTWGQP